MWGKLRFDKKKLRSDQKNTLHTQIFPNPVISDQILIVIWHQMEFFLVPNQPEKCNYDQNFGSIQNYSENVSLCVTRKNFPPKYIGNIFMYNQIYGNEILMKYISLKP